MWCFPTPWPLSLIHIFIEVTCYDRIRYLKANASYAFYNQTAAQIIAQIAADLQLDTSALADTGYAIPSLIETDQSCLDIMQGVLEQTLLNTGTIYVLYDDGNGLNVIKNPNQFSDSANGVLVGKPVAGYPKDCLLYTSGDGSGGPGLQGSDL